MSSAANLDKQALVKVYEHYSSEIFRYAYRMLDNKDFAEDCVADTFLRLMIAVRGGVVPENMRAYLFRIAHNWIMDHYRRHPQSTISLEAEAHTSPDGNPSNLVANNLDRQQVRSALLRLPAEQRQVIELRFMENWSHHEIASAVGKTVEATRAMQYRALETLRQMLVE